MVGWSLGFLVDTGCWLVGGKLLGYLVGGVDGGVGDELLLELVMLALMGY